MTTPDHTKPPSLQKPAFIYARGDIRPWDDAMLHVTVEGVQRGMNIFEGLKGFWQTDGRFGLRSMRRHHARMRRSAEIMHMPFTMGFEEFDAACHAITACQRTTATNMWIRATLFLVEGHWGQGDVSDLVLCAYQYPKGDQPRMKTGVSTWRRASDNAVPARVKSSFNYIAARFAKIEGRSRGYPEMVLLNEQGRVAEFIGSGLLMVRDGAVFAPPASEGAFESITVDLIRAICADLGIPFQFRPIERTELIIADEIGSVGTLNDIMIIESLDERPKGAAPILEAISARYMAAVTGLKPHPVMEMTFGAAAVQTPGPTDAEYERHMSTGTTSPAAASAHH